MCPEQNLFSALCDGEVPSPWRERLEQHLQTCTACAQRMHKWRALGSVLRQPVPELTGERLEASFASLVEKRQDALQRGLGTAQRRREVKRWLGTSIKVPLPALAAALFVAVFIPSFFAVRTSAGSRYGVESNTLGQGMLQETQVYSSPVYSPDLSYQTITGRLIRPANNVLTSETRLFRLVQLAEQYAENYTAAETSYQSDPEIIIIRLPSPAGLLDSGERVISTLATMSADTSPIR